MQMYGSLCQFGVKIPGVRNAWSPWIDHIMAQKQQFDFEAAAILSDAADHGYLHDSTEHFIPSESEVKVCRSSKQFVTSVS